MRVRVRLPMISWKSLVIVAAVVVLSAAFYNPYLSQASFEDDYQGFLKTYDNYRSAQSNYVTTRNQYLQYGTLNSKNDALSAVKTFLVARDDVLLSHISLIKGRNADTTYNSLLDNTVSFLQDHKSRVPAVGSLDDAVKISQEVESKDSNLQSTSRKVVGSLLVAKVDGLKLQFLVLENNAQDLITKLKNNGKNVEVQERWLLDAKNKRLLIEDKLLQARTKINNLQDSNADSINAAYNEIQTTVFEANQYLREGMQFINELAQSIKYGNFWNSCTSWK